MSILRVIEEKTGTFQREVRERTVGYVIAAFSFVAGLAWNEAMKALIEYFYPFGNNTIRAKLLYALLVTFLLVFLSVVLVHWSRRDKSEKKL
jgi:hypothetical protein